MPFPSSHHYHSLLKSAALLPPYLTPPTPIISFVPIALPVPDRPVPLEIRVTFPAPAGNIADTSTSSTTLLPIILLSHGHGGSNWLSSHHGYAPLASFYASHGFCVLQPTHLSSKFLGLLGKPNQEGLLKDMAWQSRAEDMAHILDTLDVIETSVPGNMLIGRLDREKVGVVGHSLGAWTAQLLMGASNTDPRTGVHWRKLEPRIKAGVVLAGLGNANGGRDISETGRTAYIPFYGGEFERMKTPALVVYGDEDVGPHLTTRGADWHGDAYTCAPGKKDQLVLKGARHGLGGVAGWDAAETKDESPELLGIVQRMTWAYLKSALFEGDETWSEACKVFRELARGVVESKD